MILHLVRWPRFRCVLALLHSFTLELSTFFARDVTLFSCNLAPPHLTSVTWRHGISGPLPHPYVTLFMDGFSLLTHLLKAARRQASVLKIQSRSVEITIIMLKFRSNILCFKTRNFLKLLTTDFVAVCGFFLFFVICGKSLIFFYIFCEVFLILLINFMSNYDYLSAKWV